LSLFCLGLDESHPSNQPSSDYSTPDAEPVIGAPCYYQHSGLDLNNQDLRPQSQLTDSREEFFQTIDLPTSYSIKKGLSRRCRCLVREPFVGGLEDGWDYQPRINSRTPYHPYIRVLKNPYRKRMPAVKFEPDASKLQTRLIHEGGDPGAIKLLINVFPEGVNLSALTRQKTAEEVASQTFGQGPGQVFLGFLETVQIEQNWGGDATFRYRCRLCPDIAKTTSWKHERDVLRHLRKHHFGLANECELWCVNPDSCISLSDCYAEFSGKRVYTTGEMRSHRCVPTKKSHC